MNKDSKHAKRRPLSPNKTPIGYIQGKVELIHRVSPALQKLQNKSYLRKIHQSPQSIYLKNFQSSVDPLITESTYQPLPSRSRIDSKFSSRILPIQTSVESGRRSLSKSKLLVRIITPTAAFSHESGMEYPNRISEHMSYVGCHDEFDNSNFEIYEKELFPDYGHFHPLDSCTNDEISYNQSSQQELRSFNTEPYESGMDRSILPRRCKTRLNRFDKFLAHSFEINRSKPRKRCESRGYLSVLLKPTVNPPRTVNYKTFNSSKVEKTETRNKSFNLKDKDSIMKIAKKYYVKSILDE